jgi:hypothetical protein
MYLGLFLKKLRATCYETPEARRVGRSTSDARTRSGALIVHS